MKANNIYKAMLRKKEAARELKRFQEQIDRDIEEETGFWKTTLFIFVFAIAFLIVGKFVTDLLEWAFLS